ncbi:MAG TPA: translation initiation factor IF-3 [Deltaproteobacteria bacterium]|nr:translation initiation factor IF-3 [Deltaproteobacteria bacterium]
MRRRRHVREQPRHEGPRINDQIRASRVVVIDESGQRLGEFLGPDAVQFARDRGLDLIEVSPESSPPICKIADHGRLKYERQKKRRAARSRASQPQMKEIKLRPKTGDHDLGVKIRRAREFLERGDRVKVAVWFRGREHAHHDIGTQQCLRIADAVDDVASIDTRPHMQGRRMYMVLAPS